MGHPFGVKSKTLLCALDPENFLLFLKKFSILHWFFLGGGVSCEAQVGLT